jgi:hypothetical protein
MSEFSTLQTQVREVQTELESQKRQIFLAGERIKRLDLDKQHIARGQGVESDAFDALSSEQNQWRQTIAAGKARLDEVSIQAEGLLEAFGPFMDPRTNLARLPDSHPILLLPVRMETRFKVVDDGEDEPRHQLWVRVFPDECSIDTFDDVLSQSEVIRARNYWSAVWRAGSPANAAMEDQVRKKRLGAWQKLMGHFNAGRAHWVTTEHQPQNADSPPRHNASDQILVIPTDTPPSPADQQALEVYWEAAYRAAGDQQQLDDALAALVTATGDAQTVRDLIVSYVPQNLDEPPDEVVPNPAVTVVFLVFDKNVDAKLTSWSQAARVRTFPEKFVLLGFQGNDAEPVINQLGARIPNPLIVGPDTRDDIDTVLTEEYGAEFADLSDEEKAARYMEYLAERADTQWLFDFDRAVAMGLGFKVDLTPVQFRTGFTRLMVVGIQLGSGHDAGRTALEELLRNHQFGESGFSLLSQGTPTNNTEDNRSGHSEQEDAETAFERYSTDTPPEDPLDPSRKRDGRRLAEVLGIDPELAALPTAENYYGRDQMEAQAMHAALWNSTIGYFLESMAPPLASDAGRDIVRAHLLQHVRGRGLVPAIRIGDQPYGILPISNLDNLTWLSPKSLLPGLDKRAAGTLRAMYGALKVMRADMADVLNQIAYVGKNGDAHEILLQALGLHAGSVEFDRRVAESFDQIKNAYYAQGLLGDDIDNLDQEYKNRGLRLLEGLGYRHDTETDPEIPILTRSFLGAQEDVTKDLIDDAPLSEERGIRAYTDDGSNYIDWLIEHAKNDHATIRNQQGFTDNKRPAAILYDLLRHAVNLEFANSSIRLYEQAGILNTEEAAQTRMDANFIGVQPDNELLQSKWDLIYRQDERVAPAGTVIADHIATLLRTSVATGSTQQLRAVLDALEILKDSPTARLERCLVEHLDCCHYRLDAWLMSFLHLQLEIMRKARPRHDVESGDIESVGTGGGRGIYLGAYGWVEDLKPDFKQLEPAELDEEQQEIFDPDGVGDVVTDNTNAGYLHAPSIAHGLTAAVLRNAYISTASAGNAGQYKVNLSSERVRMALGIIEGMQQGQNLAELLGYRLERGLHDNNDEELDIFIYELRKVFPLVSNRLKLTAVKIGKIATNALENVRFPEEEAEFEEDRAVTKVEARNVVNGLALLEHVKTTGNSSYPFGFATGSGADKLRDATPDERDAIDAEVQRLMNVRDAVADLAIAESVHQVVQGNYDRAAGTLDAYSKGQFPQLPDVVRSSTSGVVLTHRFGIHLPAGVSPDAGDTPRSKAEPAVNAWLEDLFPPAANIVCMLRFRTPIYEGDVQNPWNDFPVSLQVLGLEPIDLLYLYDADSEKTLGALDDHVLRLFRASTPPRADLEIEINYTEPVGGNFTFFQLGAMLAELRALVVAARPLEASDVALQNEGAKAQNVGAAVDISRITKAKAQLDTSLAGLKIDVIDVLSPLLDLEDVEVGLGNFTPIATGFETLANQFVVHMADLSRFGLAGAGSGFIYDRERAVSAALYAKVLAFRNRWDDYHNRYQEIVNTQLPDAGSDEERIALLHRAEALISATQTTTFANVAALQLAVEGKKPLFDAKHGDVSAFVITDFSTLLAQFNAVDVLIAGMDVFDLQPLDVADEARLLIVLAEDLLNQSQQLHESATQKSLAVQDLIDSVSGLSSQEALQAMQQASTLLFGEDFALLPEFTLSGDQALELQNCLDDQAQLLSHQKTVVGSDFPVDDWLYGVARVREKAAAWENLVMLAEGFRDRPSLDLTPLQLPYQENDSWLALAYPASRTIEGDSLLYTAYAPALNSAQPQVGLLVDEWTEIIPAEQETTAMTFHYDRPNCEAPQSMLLVTPSSVTGEWEWQDVVASLHEGLEMARLRALEPDQIDQTDYARLLPATVATMTYYPVTMALNYAATAVTVRVFDDG